MTPEPFRQASVSEILGVLTARRDGDPLLVEAALVGLHGVGVATGSLGLVDALLTALALASGTTTEDVLRRMALASATLEDRQ